MVDEADAPQLPLQVRALMMRRVRLAAAVERQGEALRVPRAGRVERWLARLVHRGGDPRVRLVLDAHGRRVLDALDAVGPGASVPALADTLEVRLPVQDDGAPDPHGALEPAAVSLLVFLHTLSAGGVLVTEPI